ncbi:hypothetical protein RZS08_48845, partial [Arthrospira platensis SPKY1]|nr:hypothetical protein [Arthrospira platensis SPKY1]
ARQAQPPWYTRRFVHEFGVIAEPEIVRLMAALANKKPSRAAAHAWFGEHAEFVRAHRDQLAGEPNAAELLGIVER